MRFVPRLPEERANVTPGSTLSELALLLVGGIAALALLLWLAGFAADALASRIPPARERAMFAAVADQVRLEAGDDRDRLEPLLARLAPAPPRPALGVLEAPELNALALPGRAILVTRGLLDEVDDDELAFVLAHELAHLDHRDNLRGLGRGLVLAAALSLLGLDSGASPADLAGLVSRVSLTRYSRGRELAADAAAVRRLLARGAPGSDATAALRLLERPCLRQVVGRLGPQGVLGQRPDPAPELVQRLRADLRPALVDQRSQLGLPVARGVGVDELLRGVGQIGGRIARAAV